MGAAAGMVLGMVGAIVAGTEIRPQPQSAVGRL